MNDMLVDGFTSGLPSVAEVFLAMSEPLLENGKNVTHAFKGEEVVATAEKLESEEFVVPAMVVDSSSVVFVNNEVEERLIVPAEDLEDW